jgi:hypothetical protein
MAIGRPDLPALRRRTRNTHAHTYFDANKNARTYFDADENAHADKNALRLERPR